ncbi:MAG: hypothetical protein LBD38_02915 [Streptococcaceae bacterium]|jgi:hypothetical protein|nr:hypothetical protein [Streptococcaceae bacterium]
MKKKRIQLIAILALLFLSACHATSENGKDEFGTIELKINQIHTVGENKKAVNDPPKLVKPKFQQPVAQKTSSSTSSSSSKVASSSTTTSSKEVESTGSSLIPRTTKIMPNHLYYDGWAIPYQEGGVANGQAIIDSNPPGIASTWGGKTPFSGTDNLNTHFIGHHWGAFDCFVSVPVGAIIKVTDAQAHQFSYKVERMAVVNEVAIDQQTGKNLYSEITSTGGGERIVIQTCLSETTRNILFCSLA